MLQLLALILVGITMLVIHAYGFLITLLVAVGIFLFVIIFNLIHGLWETRDFHKEWKDWKKNQTKEN
jgi:hypothetical protein